jgi:tRNA1(Val) A37 N6-methylase TrmN6
MTTKQLQKANYITEQINSIKSDLNQIGIYRVYDSDYEVINPKYRENGNIPIKIGGTELTHLSREGATEIRKDYVNLLNKKLAALEEEFNNI